MRLRLNAQDTNAVGASLHGGVQQLRAVRALVPKQLAGGASAPEVAEHVSLTTQAVRETCPSLPDGRLAQCVVRTRSAGCGRGVSTEEKQCIVAMACTDPPVGAARWKVR
jgi:hypothetical protein